MPFHEHQDILPEPDHVKPRGFVMRSLAALFLAALAAYWLVSYCLLPRAWERYEKHHPALVAAPRVTHTKNDIPGDPINLALIGDEEALQQAMHAAKWYPADPVTLKSSLRIAEDTVLRRPYEDAPVSPLFLFGRHQDLAFEQPVGNDPRQRHHVRFWKAEETDAAGRPLWFGAATYDVRVGLSDTTGQITHHISLHVDADRELVLLSLTAVGALQASSYIPAFQPELQGKNGGGDTWQTDGRLAIGWLKPWTPTPK